MSTPDNSDFRELGISSSHFPSLHNLRLCIEADRHAPSSSVFLCPGAVINSKEVTSLDTVFLFGDQKASTPMVCHPEAKIFSEQHSDTA